MHKGATEQQTGQTLMIWLLTPFSEVCFEFESDLALKFELQVPGGLRLRVCGSRAEEGLSHHQPQPATRAGARALKVWGKCEAVWEGMEEGCSGSSYAEGRAFAWCSHAPTALHRKP